jgi:hypothetical protein
MRPFHSLPVLPLILLWCSVGSASLLDDILAKLEAAVDCGSCLALMVALKGLSELGDGAFVTVFTEVCDASKVRPQSLYLLAYL